MLDAGRVYGYRAPRIGEAICVWLAAENVEANRPVIDAGLTILDAGRVYGYRAPRIGEAICVLLAAENVEANRPVIDAGLTMLDAGGDFADGVIAYEGMWLGRRRLFRSTRKRWRCSLRRDRQRGPYEGQVGLNRMQCQKANIISREIDQCPRGPASN